MLTPNIPHTIKTTLEIIFTYAKDIEYWARIKEELMTYLISEHRALFTKKDEKNRHQLNEMEKEIIELWMHWGGKRLRLYQDYE